MKKVIYLLMGLMFLTASFASAAIVLDRIVAVVDREVITWSELYKAMEFELSDKFAGLSPEEKRQQLKKHEKEYLERLIDMKVQLNEAKRLNIGLSREEIDSAIAQIRKKYGLTEEKFLEALKQEGFTFEEYKTRVAEQIVLSKLVNIEVRSKLMVSEGEIDRYIKENGDSVDLSEGYRIRQIFFPASTPEEKREAEEKADEVLGLLKAGEPFDSLARRYSKGPNASRGGDLGFIKKNDLAQEFLVVIEKTDVGGYSKPFWSDKGLHIIMLEERNPSNSEVSMKERARVILTEDKFRKAFNDWLRSLKSRVFIEVKL